MTETEAPAAPAALELSLDPADLPLLLRQPAFRAAARRRARRCSVIWHDTPEGALAAAGLVVAEHRQEDAPVFQLERLVPGAADHWPPSGMAPVLRSAPDLAQLGEAAPPHLLPVAAFEGGSRRLTPPDADLVVTLLEGELRAITATATICRLTMAGAGAGALALELAGQMRLGAPSQGLAGEALTLARRQLPPRPLGAPLLAPEFDAGQGFAFVVAHLAGVILHHAPAARADGGPEPVHQMRVALRRLRSAILLFRRAVACPELDALSARLKSLGAVLGPARDWDVFTAGTGARVGAAFPDDPAVTALRAAAERRRQTGYAALRRHLDGPEFRQTMIALALMSLHRPWQAAVHEDPARAEQAAEWQRTQLSAYAAHALDRRLARVVTPGADLGALALPALHDIRLHAKRLRYAGEFFSPLFPGRQTRRFLRRLSAVQERLGLINDGAVAQSLMAELGGRGPGRQTAIGIVRGFVAARSGAGLRKLERSWQRFLKLEPFWS